MNVDSIIRMVLAPTVDATKTKVAHKLGRLLIGAMVLALPVHAQTDDTFDTTPLTQVSDTLAIEALNSEIERPDTLLVDWSRYDRFSYIRIAADGKLPAMTDGLFDEWAGRVLFPVNRKQISEDDAFIREFEDEVLPMICRDSLQLMGVVVRGASSPDGPKAFNEKIAQQRAQSLVDYISQLALPQSSVAAFNQRYDAEDYYSLCQLMRLANDEDYQLVRYYCDQYLPYGLDDDLKRSLKTLQEGRLWRRLLREYFPQLRQARIVLFLCPADVSPVIPDDVAVDVSDELASLSDLFSVVDAQESNSEDSLSNVVASTDNVQNGQVEPRTQTTPVGSPSTKHFPSSATPLKEKKDAAKKPVAASPASQPSVKSQKADDGISEASGQQSALSGQQPSEGEQPQVAAEPSQADAGQQSEAASVSQPASESLSVASQPSDLPLEKGEDEDSHFPYGPVTLGVLALLTGGGYLLWRRTQDDHEEEEEDTSDLITAKTGHRDYTPTSQLKPSAPKTPVNVVPVAPAVVEAAEEITGKPTEPTVEPETEPAGQATGPASENASEPMEKTSVPEAEPVAEPAGQPSEPSVEVEEESERAEQPSEPEAEPAPEQTEQPSEPEAEPAPEQTEQPSEPSAVTPAPATKPISFAHDAYHAAHEVSNSSGAAAAVAAAAATIAPKPTPTPVVPKVEQPSVQHPISFEQNVAPAVPDELREAYDKITSLVQRKQLFRKADFDRDQLIKVSGYEKNRLSAIISKCSGTNIPGYINRMRVEYAAQMLKDNPDSTVQSVAVASGFVSQTTFIRAFKNVFGMTPSDFKLSLTADSDKA